MDVAFSIPRKTLGLRPVPGSQAVTDKKASFFLILPSLLLRSTDQGVQHVCKFLGSVIL